MAEKDKEDSVPLKYRYVEEFPESIDPETGKPYEGIESPKVIETEHFGKVELHRIAKVNWTETKYKQVYETEGKDGTVEEKEFVIRVYDEKMGELGGWIESKKNLAQAGECWVSDKAVVLGGAQVVEDAEVSGEAEIGEDAVIGGKAKVTGQVCIKGNAHVVGEADIDEDKEELEADVDEKWKKGKKRKVVAASDYATVKGTMRGTAKVYGNAYVGPYSKISEKAKVFGYSHVEGTENEWANVEDEAKVYGMAVVNGTVRGKSSAYGTACIGSGGELEEEVSIRSGTVCGLITGKVLLEFLFLFVGKGAKLAYYKEGESRPALSWCEKDMSQSKNGALTSSGYGGYRRGVLVVGGECTVEYCSLYGRVVLKDTKVRYCSIADSELDGCDLYDCGIVQSRLAKLDAEKSILVKTEAAGGGRLKDCSVSHGVVPKGANWIAVSESGVTDIATATGVGMYGATRSGMSVPPVAYPYAKESNYIDRSANGATILVKREEPKKVEKIKTAYGTFSDDEYGRMSMRYYERWGKIQKLLKPMEDRAEALNEIGRSGEMTEEQREEQSSLDYAIMWVGSAAFSPSLFDMYEEVWDKVYSAIEQSANESLGSRKAHLYAPYRLKFVWRKSNYYQWLYIPDFTGGMVEITPFNGQINGPYIATKVNGKVYPIPYQKGYLEFVKYTSISSIFDYALYGGFNTLIGELSDGNAVALLPDQDTIVEIPYRDLVEAYDSKMEALQEELDKVGPGAGWEGDLSPEAQKVLDEMAAAYESYQDALADRLDYAGQEAVEKAEEAKRSESDAKHDEYWKAEQERREQKEYVSARQNATNEVRRILTNVRNLDNSESSTVSSLGAILGELLYGSPSKEQCEEMKNQAAEIYAQYLQRITEKSNG